MDVFGKAIWQAILSTLVALTAGAMHWLASLEASLRLLIARGMRHAVLTLLLVVLLFGGTLEQLTQAGIGVIPTAHAHAFTNTNTAPDPSDPRLNATVPTHPLATPSTPPSGPAPTRTPNIARNG